MPPARDGAVLNPSKAVNVDEWQSLPERTAGDARFRKTPSGNGKTALELELNW
jgi:hypothetical protein